MSTYTVVRQWVSDRLTDTDQSYADLLREGIRAGYHESTISAASDAVGRKTHTPRGMMIRRRKPRSGPLTVRSLGDR
jgi:hypothetical protein